MGLFFPSNIIVRGGEGGDVYTPELKTIGTREDLEAVPDDPGLWRKVEEDGSLWTSLIMPGGGYGWIEFLSPQVTWLSNTQGISFSVGDCVSRREVHGGPVAYKTSVTFGNARVVGLYQGEGSRAGLETPIAIQTRGDMILVGDKVEEEVGIGDLCFWDGEKIRKEPLQGPGILLQVKVGRCVDKTVRSDGSRVTRIQIDLEVVRLT